VVSPKYFQDDPDPPPFIKALAEVRHLAKAGVTMVDGYRDSLDVLPNALAAYQPRILPEQASGHWWVTGTVTFPETDCDEP
jgi:hypothetical protein